MKSIKSVFFFGFLKMVLGGYITGAGTMLGICTQEGREGGRLWGQRQGSQREAVASC